MKPTIYITGPMTGYENYNMLAFLKAAAILKYLGWEVINPAETSFQLAYTKSCTLEEIDHKDYLKEDLKLIETKADYLFHLNGWEKSSGVIDEREAFYWRCERKGWNMKERCFFEKDGYAILLA